MTVLKPGQPIRTTGNNLVGLWRPSFVKVDHRLFVYGGGGNVTDNLHVLNLHTMRWDTVQVNTFFLVFLLSPLSLPSFAAPQCTAYMYDACNLTDSHAPRRSCRMSKVLRLANDTDIPQRYGITASSSLVHISRPKFLLIFCSSLSTRRL